MGNLCDAAGRSLSCVYRPLYINTIAIVKEGEEGRIEFLCRNQAGIYGSRTHEKLKDLAREIMGENTPSHKTLPEETPQYPGPCRSIMLERNIPCKQITIPVGNLRTMF